MSVPYLTEDGILSSDDLNKCCEIDILTEERSSRNKSELLFLYHLLIKKNIPISVDHDPSRSDPITSP